MTDPIDYSRPVGWWCPVCGASGAIANKNYAEHYAQGFLVCGDGCGSIIRPVYLPIPEGQRPPAASEVEEAEVVTWCGIAYDWHGRPDLTRRRWVVSVETDGVRHINYIVTGATE